MKKKNFYLVVALIISGMNICFSHQQNIPIFYQNTVRVATKYLHNENVTLIHDDIEFIRELSLKPDIEDSFHTVDVCSLADRLMLWNTHLPQVNIHYAMKTNHDLIISSVMAALGTGFDCASEREIRQILKLGVSPEKIIFSHPRKPISEIKFAEKNKINWMVFDSIEELDKMLSYAPSGQYLLRIKTDDEHSETPLSSKFGSSIEDAYKILDYGFRKNAPIVGISFHVGSNNSDETAFSKALKDSSLLFKYSEQKWKHHLTLLDLGGGWPGNNDDRFILFSKTVNNALAKYFPSNVQVIAEPGRFFATSTTTAVVRIIGSQKKQTPGGLTFAYYLANGAYGLFSASIYFQYDPQKLYLEGWEFHPLTKNQKRETKLYPSVFWGPTCDSGDKIFESILFPKMKTNEFIYSQNVGSYTYSAQTAFNQITPSKAYYVCSLKKADFS